MSFIVQDDKSSLIAIPRQLELRLSCLVVAVTGINSSGISLNMWYVGSVHLPIIHSEDR
ncbi:unnamed protein product, partial [Dicrocoelium dendriticum]